MDRNSVADLTIPIENVEIPDEVLAEIEKKSRPQNYAWVDLDRVASLPVRGRYIFMALCLLTKVQYVTRKSVKKEMRPWFFVKTAFWKEWDIPENSWYRAVNTLVSCGIIKKREGTGMGGRNLYAFTDMLQKNE